MSMYNGLKNEFERKCIKDGGVFIVIIIIVMWRVRGVKVQLSRRYTFVFFSVITYFHFIQFSCL